MRCPHCSGEIPPESQFCGICGRHISAGGGPALRTYPPPASSGSSSLFELPAARGPRMARIVVVLALDLILAGAGIAMILSYLLARQEVERAAATPARSASAEVEVGPALPVVAGDEGAEEAAAKGAAGSPVAEQGERLPAARASGAVSREDEDRRREPERRSAAKSPPRAGDEDAEDDESGAAGPEPGEERAASRDAGAASAGDAGIPTDDEVARFAGRIDAVVARHQSQLHRCYERASKTSSPEEPLAGRVDIRFRIMPDGTADSARPVANSTGSEVLAGCLVAVIETWDFPRGASAPLEFVWPFRFRPQR
jgi:hypothetical protein